MRQNLIFRDREHAARLLAVELRDKGWGDILVLGIPRGGVVTGVTLARELDADFDVVLARKLRSPGHPELAIGAVAEGGHCHMDAAVCAVVAPSPAYVEEEKSGQMAEIARRQLLFRGDDEPQPAEGRTVIVTDDGVATGSTLIAALMAARARRPAWLVAAVPVSAPDSLADIAAHCDEVACLSSPEGFQAVGQFYRDFDQVGDDEAVDLFRRYRAAARA